MSQNEIPVKEISELFDMMAQKMPSLIKDLFSVLYSTEGATNMSNAISIFYKNLMEAGMDKSDALKLTTEYMGHLKALTNFNQQGPKGS